MVLQRTSPVVQKSTLIFNTQFSSALLRQVNEAFIIIIAKAECILNSKSEWHQAPLVRIVPMSGLQEDQGAGRGSLLQGGEKRGRGRGSQGRGQGRGGDRASKRIVTS